MRHRQTLTEESSIHERADSSNDVFNAVPVEGDTTLYPSLGGLFTITNTVADVSPVDTLNTNKTHIYAHTYTHIYIHIHPYIQTYIQAGRHTYTPTHPSTCTTARRTNKHAHMHNSKTHKQTRTHAQHHIEEY